MTGAIITATNESYGDVSILSHELDKIKLKKHILNVKLPFKATPNDSTRG